MKTRHATINTNEGNLPFARPISETEFNKLKDNDFHMYGDAIVYMDGDMLLHIPFQGVRHLQPPSEFIYPDIKMAITKDVYEKFITELRSAGNSIKPI